MINLLPPAEKETLHKEFRKRLLSVYLLLFSVVLAIGVIALLPSYFLTDVRERIAEEERSKLINSAESDEREEINAKLLQTKTLLTTVSKTDLRPPLHIVIDEIAAVSEGSIAIDSLSYTRRFGGEDSSLSVSGNASTRDGLLAFTRSLEDNEKISEAVLPVASLAKDRDIDFNIEIRGQF